MDKERATRLKSSLLGYGISCFVAHEDIEPTKEWQSEIEKALFSMDALAAILSPDFHGSKWTDQEVGVALGRGVLVLPVRSGVDPYGLMGKYQGIQAESKLVGDVCRAVYGTLAKNVRTQSRLLECLADQLTVAQTPEVATQKIELLDQLDEVPTITLHRIRENAVANPVLSSNDDVLSQVNRLLSRYNIEPISKETEQAPQTDDDIPF